MIDDRFHRNCSEFLENSYGPCNLCGKLNIAPPLKSYFPPEPISEILFVI